MIKYSSSQLYPYKTYLIQVLLKKKNTILDWIFNSILSYFRLEPTNIKPAHQQTNSRKELKNLVLCSGWIISLCLSYLREHKTYASFEKTAYLWKYSLQPIGIKLGLYCTDTELIISTRDRDLERERDLECNVKRLWWL